MNAFLAVLLVLFLFAFVTIGVGVVRRPLIGRIAMREAFRRPGQAAVLVVGLMIAGAAIFSIQVVFDSTYETNRAQALQNWGRDDVEISGGGVFFDPGLADQLAAGTHSCSCIAAIQNAIVTTGSVVDLDRQAAKPNVQITGLDLAAQQRFGSFVLSTGRSTFGGELAAGGVFVSQPLADSLGAQVGDRLHVIAAGSTGADVTVAGIVHHKAVSEMQKSSGVGTGAYGNDRAIFASLATVQQLDGAGRVNLVRVSAQGDGDAEVANGSRASTALSELIATDAPGLRVLEVKRAALNIVLKESENGRPFVSSFSVIVALAATALVANLALMLSEERRPRLAVLRALGLTRAGLVQLAVTEGAIYSLLGAVAGLPAGLALALVVVNAPAQSLTFSLHADSLVGSVAAAALINLVTVLLASLRTTQMAISSAIRDLPEPAFARRTSRVRLGVLALVAIAGLACALSGRPPLLLLGGALLIAVAAGFSRGRVADRARYSAAGAAAAVWAIADYHYSVPNVSSGDGTGLFVYGFLVSVVALSVLVAANLRLIDLAVAPLGQISSGLRAALRPAMAYSVRRPLRSGLVISAFAIVMAILVLAQALLSAGALNRGVESGGWDVQAIVAGTDQLSVPADLQSQVARSEEFPSRTFLGPIKWTYSDFRGADSWHQDAVTFFGLSQQQLATGMGFGSSADWSAIGRDPHLVAGTWPKGSVLSIATDHGTVSFKVAAHIPEIGQGGSSSVVPGLMVSQQSLDELAGAAPGAMMLLTAAPGISPSALAQNLQRATFAQGTDVNTTTQLVNSDYEISSGLTSFLLLLMRLGLIVGVASLGAVALRAVVERRRSIGMLRAVGYQPAQVLVGMLAETATVATAGLAVGVTVAYALGTALIGGLSPGAQFSPDVASLGLTIGVVYAAVLLVTFLPALRAAQLRPAEALRVTG